MISLFTVDLLVLFICIYGTLALLLGYLLGRDTRDTRHEAKQPYYPSGSQQSFALKGQENKPGGIFTSTRTSVDEDEHIIHRPSAKQIAKWNEDPQIQSEKAALAETFAQDPSLKAAKQFMESVEKNGTNN